MCWGCRSQGRTPRLPLVGVLLLSSRWFSSWWRPCRYLRIILLQTSCQTSSGILPVISFSLSSSRFAVSSLSFLLSFLSSLSPSPTWSPTWRTSWRRGISLLGGTSWCGFCFSLSLAPSRRTRGTDYAYKKDWNSYLRRHRDSNPRLKTVSVTEFVLRRESIIISCISPFEGILSMAFPTYVPFSFCSLPRGFELGLFRSQGGTDWCVDLTSRLYGPPKAVGQFVYLWLLLFYLGLVGAFWLYLAVIFLYFRRVSDLFWLHLVHWKLECNCY